MNEIHYNRADAEQQAEPAPVPYSEVVRHGFHQPGAFVKGRRVYIVTPTGALRRIDGKKKRGKFRKSK